MLRGSNPRKRQQWTERLERYAKSGQSAAAFCRTEGVSAASFYQWKRKLGIAGQNKKRPAHGRRWKSSAFQRLHVSPTEVSSGVRVRLPDGILIDLGSNLLAIEKTVAQVLDHQRTKGTGSC